MSGNREKPCWEGKHYSFFQNVECEYFPCHRIEDPARFNCLFCYCPLYMLGPHCGGNFRYTEKGIKDCTECVIPHLPGNYGRITGKYKEIAAAMRRTELCCQTELQQKKAVSSEKPFGRIVMMACTVRGVDTMRRAAAALEALLPEAELLQTGRCAYVPGFEDGPRLSEVTAEWFPKTDAFIFFAAAGIAVRCIAPFARDKFRDPAVLVMDENRRFAISLMSGHAGRANRLCQMLAEAVGAQPVITTATDGRGLFAVDAFAAENSLQISDRKIAGQVSARLLAGENLKIFFEEGHIGQTDYIDGKPEEMPTNTASEKRKPVRSQALAHRKMDLDFCKKNGKGVCRTSARGGADIILSCRKTPNDRENALYLIPRAVTLGIGCRKGISAEAVQKAARQVLQTSGVFRQALSGIASIDLKKGERGLRIFAEEWNLPLTFYTAEELAAVPGSFTGSEFVRNVTGVDCVCERSAVRLALDRAGFQDGAAPRDDALPQAGSGVILLEKKQSFDGVTMALAVNTENTINPGQSAEIADRQGFSG